MNHTSPRFVLKTVRSCLKRMGIAAFPKQPEHHYAPIYYGRNFHERTDIRSLPLFGELAERVIQQGRTYLYYDRLYILYQSLANLKCSSGGAESLNSAEVGVYRGGTSYFIAAAAAALGLPLIHYCFDTFEGHPEEDIQSGIDLYEAKVFSDTDFATVKEYLKGFENVHIFKGRFQDSCAKIADKTFHIVHVDVDLYEPTQFSLEFFDSRLAVGGIIVVDDYEVHKCPGIKQSVEEFLNRKKNYFSCHPLTEQIILVKTSR